MTIRDEICFVDTETTGLDADRHEIWELAWGVWDRDSWHVSSCQFPVDLGRADPYALKVGHFHERAHQWIYPNNALQSATKGASRFSRVSAGKHLTGMNPSFDEERLRGLLRANGACPDWHYHLFDLEAAVVGAMMNSENEPTFPWKSDQLSLWLDVNPDQFDRHTAEGDVKWSIACFEALYGHPVS